MELSNESINVLESWWTKKAADNFLAFRRFIRDDKLLYGWFIIDLCIQLQQFYLDLIAGKRPILAIQTPPQHGKSWAITDFIAWVLGRHPELRIIFASFSEYLGVRTNRALQKYFISEKYNNIFPDFSIGKKRVVAMENAPLRNNSVVETNQGGFFRNTTVRGPVTGESLDLGIIDDPIKGREEANSPTFREKTWDWFTDDFGTRFSDSAGLLIIMTRWHVDDLIGRLKKEYPNTKTLNYPALATKDAKHRREKEPLFPELKSKKFLMGKQRIMSDPNFSALYQGNPVVLGGDLIKDEWWRWQEVRPRILFKFIVADTAQKTKTQNDYTDLACWGYGVDGRIHILDHIHDKFKAPALRREALAFYNKHNTPRKALHDPVMRGMFIEDKSSGTGLIQELEEEGCKVFEVPRQTDKIMRCDDASPHIAAGQVVLYADVHNVGVITQEAREFPNGEHDDAIDNVFNAIEVAFINKLVTNSLQAAMEADDG